MVNPGLSRRLGSALGRGLPSPSLSSLEAVRLEWAIRDWFGNHQDAEFEDMPERFRTYVEDVERRLAA